MCIRDRYRWSRFSEYIASKRSLVLCDTDYVLDIFGGIEEFMRFHQVKDDDAVCLDADAAGKTRPMRDEEALALVPVSYTHLAVLRPTPGSFCSSSMSRGISPP